jgi:hypothetical protein
VITTSSLEIKGGNIFQTQKVITNNSNLKYIASNLTPIKPNLPAAANTATLIK